MYEMYERNQLEVEGKIEFECRDGEWTRTSTNVTSTTEMPDCRQRKKRGIIKTPKIHNLLVKKYPKIPQTE